MVRKREREKQQKKIKRGKTLKNSMIMLFSRNSFQQQKKTLKEDLFPKKLILINRWDLLSDI